jgi:hypothetical protein
VEKMTDDEVVKIALEDKMSLLKSSDVIKTECTGHLSVSMR